MFASNFTIKDESLKFVRGEDKIKTYATNKTIESGNTMTNYFCSNCGSLMWRASSGWPGTAFMRIGQVDDHKVQEIELKPQIEQFTRSRVTWLKTIEGAQKHDAMMPA